MRVLMPRSRKDSAQTSCTSWQTCTHRPHLMHLVKSRMIEPLEASSGTGVTMRLMFSVRMPKSAASACSSQVPLRPQVRQLLGCVESSSSRTVRRMSVSSPLLVVTSMPSTTGVQQARGMRGWPAICTIHRPQAAVGSRSSSLHRVGIFTCTCRAASRMVVPARTVTSRPLILSVTSGRGNGGVEVAVATMG